MAKKKKEWSEAELIQGFSLQRIGENFQLLDSWLSADTQLAENEQVVLERLRKLAIKKADFWNEESLKMNFIAPLFENFIQFNDEQDRYESFYNETISATVEGIYLQTECDFMLAKGVGDIVKTPYFHFQEYKRSRKSPPEPMAQLITAFLIAQEKNKNGKPLYGLIIAGRSWQFVVMEGKKYAVSTFYDVALKEDLLQIIAILRKFKVILETTLLD
jgi:hypothetical protein